MDGFALIANDTYGASDSLPAYLQVVGEVMMGNEPNFLIRSDESAIIHTGGMLPVGADAVVMIEDNACDWNASNPQGLFEFAIAKTPERYKKNKIIL